MDIKFILWTIIQHYHYFLDQIIPPLHIRSSCRLDLFYLFPCFLNTSYCLEPQYIPGLSCIFPALTPESTTLLLQEALIPLIGE